MNNNKKNPIVAVVSGVIDIILALILFSVAGEMKSDWTFYFNKDAQDGYEFLTIFAYILIFSGIASFVIAAIQAATNNSNNNYNPPPHMYTPPHTYTPPQNTAMYTPTLLTNEANKVCPGCRTMLPDSAQFCGKCGLRLTGETNYMGGDANMVSCIFCGGKIGQNQNFCHHCGRRQD